jgi:PsbP-like protein
MNNDQLSKLLRIVGLLIAMQLTPLSNFQFSLGQIEQQQQQNNTNTITNMSGIKTYSYSNPIFGISMQYPYNWLGQERSYNSSSISEVLLVPIVPFVSQFGASLVIISQFEQRHNLTFSDFVKTHIDKLNKSGKIQKLNTSAPYSLSGYPAYKIAYTTMYKGVELEGMQIFSLIENKSFFITYAAIKMNYAMYMPTIQGMISSIKITR